MNEFITPEVTRNLIKMSVFLIGGYSMLAIFWGKPGSTISEVMGEMNRECPFVSVAWVTVMNVLAFHWFRW